MAPTEDVKALLKTIPKQYHKEVLKIGAIYYNNGAEAVKSLIIDIINIPNNKINSFGVWHEDSIDGG